MPWVASGTGGPIPPGTAPRRRIRHRGFSLRLEDGADEAVARAAVDRALAETGDRVHFVTEGADHAMVYVKAEFRRPDQALAKRVRRSRALAEGRGYRAFRAAGVDVPRLLFFGEQLRLLPRAGAILGTERLRGRDVARRLARGEGVEPCLRAARALAGVHAAGFVHGDAVVRNFLVARDRTYVLDLPAWGPYRRAAAESDLARLCGSAVKQGLPADAEGRLLDAYAAADAPGLGEGWRDRVGAAAAVFLAYLLERDATRPARHAARAARPGFRPRGPGSPA